MTLTLIDGLKAMNWVEFIWLLDCLRLIVALFGAGFTISELHDSILDRRVLAEAGVNGPRRLVANVNISNEALRLLIHVIFTMIAFNVLMWPTPFTAPMPVPLINRVGLIVATIALTVKSYSDRRMRASIALEWLKEHNRTSFRRRASDRHHP
jgi:hypothetical protein